MFLKQKVEKTNRFAGLMAIAIYCLIVIFFALPIFENFSANIPGSVDAFTILSRPNNILKIYSFANVNETFETIKFFLNPEQLFNNYTFFQLLHIIFGEPYAYNIFWVFSFIVSAFGAYLLIKMLTNNFVAALIGGFLFSFSSIHFMFSLGFGGAMHIEWIPLFAYFLIRFFRNQKIFNLFFTIVFFLLISINEAHFALYITLFAVIYIAYYLIKNPEIWQNKKFKYYSLGALTLLVICFIFFFGSMLATTLSENNYLNPGIEQTEWNSADLLSFFTPYSMQALWGNLFDPVNEKFSGNAGERTVYIGLVVIFLTIIAVIGRRKIKEKTKLLFWLFTALFFSVMALGPFLHFLGELNPKIPLPYLLFYHYIPFFQNIRGTGRIFIIASLAFSVLSGYGLKILLDLFSKRVNLRAIIIGAIFLLAAIEVFPSLPTSAVAPPEFYKKLAKEPGDFKIMQPLITTTYPYATMAFYYNSYHEKEFIGDDFSHFVRPQEGDLKFETETPIVNDLLHYLPWGEEKMNSRFIKHDLKKIGNFMLNHENNIKYLILDKNTIKNGGGYFTIDNFIYYKNYIENNLDVSIVDNEKNLLVYEIKPVLIHPLVLSRGQNWGNINLDGTDDQEASWLTNDTTLILQNYSDLPTKAEVSLTMFSPLPDTDKMFRKVNITINDKLKGSYLIGPSQKSYKLFFGDIQPGENIITFKVFDQNNNFIEPINESNRELTFNNTVLVKNITYQEIQDVSLPQIYEAIEQDSGDFSIIQIPTHSNYSFGTEFFKEKSIGAKQVAENDYFIDKIFDENNSSYSIDYSRLYSLYPLLVNHINWDEININFNIYNQEYFYRQSINAIHKYKIRYIILNKKELGEAAFLNFQTYIKDAFWNLSVTFENGDYFVYRINPVEYDPELLELTLGDNWGPLQWWLANQPPECKTQCRSIKNNSTLNIFNYAERENSGTLKFNATGNRQTPVTLIAHYDDKFLGGVTIDKPDQNISFQLENVPIGESYINFTVEDDQGNIIDDPSFIRIYNLGFW